MVRQLVEGLDGYAGPMFPPTLREQGNSLEVSLQSWLGPGPLVTHITDEGPLPGVGYRDSGPQKQLGISPTEPQLPRTQVGQDGLHRTNTVSTECQPPSTMVSITCFPLPPYS